ncbi:hypothetical protein NP233_g3425 [Leucocoprinus birnbaumii]|uniref:ribonuclease H n=1 Tax=Leucocoprinus birnbaumii TaxID=56174 RepID=A0AAD5VZ53_9AGAR|nr:hypothetical protein NP233_g3425 [Leucocoprinus birnbaumii]
MSNRVYHPPRIGNQTPRDIFHQNHGGKFTYLRKRLSVGVTTTSNIAIFVDGACSNNGKSTARAGMGVYFGPGSRNNFHQELTHRPTSQRAEIRAAILALQKVKELMRRGELGAHTKTVVLVMDSLYVVNAMTDWVERWRKNGWLDVNRRVVANKTDFVELDRLIDDLENEGVYVKLWHVNREHNTGADAEARKAIEPEPVYYVGTVNMGERLYKPPEYSSVPEEVVWQSPHADFSNIRCYEKWFYGYNLSAYRSTDIAIFIDGACIANGTTHAKAGMGIYFGPGSKHNISERLEYGPQTNQRAELQAAILALKKVVSLIDNGWLSTQNVVVISDSAYVVKSMTDWVYKWRENGWKNYKGLEVTNRDDFERLDDLIDDLEEYCGVGVKFWLVPRGMNQDADELAKSAIGRRVKLLLAVVMSSLQGYVDHRVLLVLQDGRAIVGVLAGFDQKSNVVLSDCKERVYSMDDGVEEIPLGLYLVKGDMIILIGEIDEAIDSSIDLSTIRADPIPPIRY